MRYLRTNTATRITVGPFFDQTDGITPEVSLTVTSEKLTLVVDTAGVPTLILDTAPTASGGNNDMVHITNDDAGFYDLELAAANVNYLGRAMLALTNSAAHCPVFHEFMILPAMIYDALVLGSDDLDANVIKVADTSQTAKDLGAINVTNLNTLSGHDPGAALVKVADLGTVQTGDSYAIVKSGGAGDAAAIKGKTDNLPSDPADESLIIAATESLASAIGALNNLSAAQVNAELVDALNVDTYAEPGQEIPPATTSLVKKIGHLYKQAINKLTQSSAQTSLYNNAGDTVDQKAATSDDGSTYTRGNLTEGP